MYRFSGAEQFPGKCLFTQGCNPQHKWYEDYPLSILEEGPSPPNDDEIAKPYLQQARIITESDGYNLILTGRYDAQKATKIMLHDILRTNPGLGNAISDNGRLISGLSDLRMTIIDIATSIPVLKLKRRRLMTVVTNMTAVARLENPRRL